MPDLLEAPPVPENDAAQDVFKSLQSFDTNNPQPVAKEEPVQKEPTEAPEAKADDSDKPEAMKPKSKLDKLGKITKPEDKKEEPKTEDAAPPKGEKEEEIKGPPPLLREALKQAKSDMAALRAELDKVRPDAEKVKELRSELESSREELAKLKAQSLNDTERQTFESLRQQHARWELEQKPEYQSEVMAPINARIERMRKIGKDASLSPVAMEALAKAVDLEDEIDRSREFRRIFKEAEIDADDFNDYVSAMSSIARDLNETYYPKMEQMQKQALEIEQAARHKTKEDMEQAKIREEQTFKKEFDYVHNILTSETLAPILADTDLNVDGITMAEALRGAQPSTDPRERAVEALSAAAIPFIIEWANKKVNKLHELEKANHIRNGTQPKRGDALQKTPEPKATPDDPNKVFKGFGSFGG